MRCDLLTIRMLSRPVSRVSDDGRSESKSGDVLYLGRADAPPCHCQHCVGAGCKKTTYASLR